MGTVGSVIAHIYHIKREKERITRESIFEPRWNIKIKKEKKKSPSLEEGIKEPLLNNHEE